MAWVLVGVAALLALAALRAVLPPAGPTPAWRARATERARGLLTRVVRQLAGPPPAPEPDPFDALRLQLRLGVLAEHIGRLEADTQVYAKAHRLKAARAAYDDLLEEACRLAGVPVHGEQSRRESDRYAQELELAARGWSW